MLRIGLADDHPAILDALAGRVEGNDARVVFSVRTSEQLFSALRGKPCDLLITDYAMAHGGDGLAMVERIRRQFNNCRVVVFTMLHNPAVFSQLLGLGIDGLVSKSDDIGEVLLALRAVQQRIGLPYRSPSVREAMHVHLRQVSGASAAPACLSQRELEVVRLFAQGQALDDIANSLERAKTTVATHKKNAMDKLGLSSNVDLIRYAYENGIV